MINQLGTNPELQTRNEAGIFLSKIQRIQSAQQAGVHLSVLLGLGPEFYENPKIVQCASEHLGADIAEEVIILSSLQLRIEWEKQHDTSGRLHVTYNHITEPSSKPFSLGVTGKLTYEQADMRSSAVGISRMFVPKNQITFLSAIPILDNTLKASDEVPRLPSDLGDETHNLVPVGS